jgi:hypothetical protein
MQSEAIDAGACSKGLPRIYRSSVSGRDLVRNSKRNAPLTGMVIEYHSDHRALVTVKIGSIVNDIRSAHTSSV